MSAQCLEYKYILMIIKLIQYFTIILCYKISVDLKIKSHIKVYCLFHMISNNYLLVSVIIFRIFRYKE